MVKKVSSACKGSDVSLFQSSFNVTSFKPWPLANPEKKKKTIA